MGGATVTRLDGKPSPYICPCRVERRTIPTSVALLLLGRGLLLGRLGLRLGLGVRLRAGAGLRHRLLGGEPSACPALLLLGARACSWSRVDLPGPCARQQAGAGGCSCSWPTGVADRPRARIEPAVADGMPEPIQPALAPCCRPRPSTRSPWLLARKMSRPAPPSSAVGVVGVRIVRAMFRPPSVVGSSSPLSRSSPSPPHSWSRPVPPTSQSLPVPPTIASSPSTGRDAGELGPGVGSTLRKNVAGRRRAPWCTGARRRTSRSRSRESAGARAGRSAAGRPGCTGACSRCARPRWCRRRSSSRRSPRAAPRRRRSRRRRRRRARTSLPRPPKITSSPPRRRCSRRRPRRCRSSLVSRPAGTRVRRRSSSR